jgi:hypothetical protein
MKHLTQNIKVTNALASLLNSALETGLNPAWFQTDTSLNKWGFLDASFEHSGLDTPSGKPASTDWSFRLRLNPDDLGKETKYTVITPRLALTRIRRFVKDDSQPEWLRTKAVVFLTYLDLLVTSPAIAETYYDDNIDHDGVVDDALCQYIVALDIVFG